MQAERRPLTTPTTGSLLLTPAAGHLSVGRRAARSLSDKHCGRPPINPELAGRIRKALAVSERPGIRVIAKHFGVSPMTMQNVARG